MPASSEHDPAGGELSRLRSEVARERRKLAALEQVASALGATLDLDELLEVVVPRISQAMDAERSTVYLLDRDTGDLTAKVAQGESYREIRLAPGEGLAGAVTRTGEPLNVQDAYRDVRFNGEWDRKTGFRTRAAVCVPMKNRHGRIIGVVQALNKREGTFSLDDETMLGALATQVAVAVENSKLFLSMVETNAELLRTQDQLEAKIRELDVLFEIATVSASAVDLDDLLEGVLVRSMRAIDADAACVLLADDVTGDLRFRAAAGGEPEAVKRLKIDAGSGISGWVAQMQRPQVVNDADGDPRHSRHISAEVGYHARSVLCVPLRWEDGTGALELLNKSGGAGRFGDDDVKLATVIAQHVSTAIEQARVRARQAQRDRLSTIGQFLSGVLHDLKTPLTVVAGYVRLLAEENDPAVRAKYAATVKRQLALLKTMIGETLAFARGERQLWARKVYLRAFFEDVAEQLRRVLADRGIALVLELEDRGVARFDENKMIRVLHNLARNAAEAIGAAGGTCTIGVRRRADGAVVITFTDDGPGVPESMRERLFESFTTHGKPSGTGLGLAVVRTLVEEHGGTISVESAPGRTCFTIVRPQPARGAEAA